MLALFLNIFFLVTQSFNINLDVFQNMSEFSPNT